MCYNKAKIKGEEMTITLKIDNIETEDKLKRFVKEQQEITLESLKCFLNSFQSKEKKETFEFEKRDPRKYSKIIKREYNQEDVSDTALLHIKDSAKYVHNLRREKR